MRLHTLILAVSAAALFGSVPVPAKTIMQARPPDLRLFVSVPPEKLSDLHRVLMEFATKEHLSEFKDADAPRAQGKQFFLFLYSDKFTFIAEKAPGARSVMIECSDLDSDYSRAQAKILKVPYGTESPFGRTVARLKQRLRAISSDISEER